SFILKIASHCIKYNCGTGIPNMNIVIYGWSADIHSYLIFFYWQECFFLSGQCIKYFNRHLKCCSLLLTSLFLLSVYQFLLAVPYNGQQQDQVIYDDQDLS